LHQLSKKFRTTGRIRQTVDAMSGPVVAALLSVVAMAQALKVWQWRLGDPIDLSGDSNALMAQIKGMVDHGSSVSNPNLGAPFHQDTSWFPHADHLHLFLTAKVIGIFSDNPFTISAIYFFLGFPLAALSMYWLARQRNLGRLGSVVAGVLFSVIPGHQIKFSHLWLASYWVVPLGMWLVLRTARGESLFRIKIDWRNPIERRQALRLDLTTALCALLTAIGGIYYSTFTLLLLGATLLFRLVATRDRRSVARAALLMVAIGTLSLSAALSVTAGQDKSTIVIAPIQRGFSESEVFAGKFMDLVLPWIYHRVDALSHATVAYNSLTTATAEKPALGLIALAGVVSLIVTMLSALIPQRVKPIHPELGILGVLTMISLSFYSIGGLGSFVALFVTPQIRTWSRFFVFIGLFGFLAVGHWVTRVSRRNRLLGVATAVALLVIGVLDQTNPAMAPNFKVLRNEVVDLTTFSQRIEAKVGPGCSVLQLPIVPFPENPPVHNMTDYDHLRPYLAATSLRWSYGAFRGTSLADWQLALPQSSTAGLINDVVGAGFCSIEVDRAGFVDNGAKLDAELTGLLGQPISTTRDGRLIAWNLAQARTELTSRIGADQVKAKGDLVLHPLVVYSDHETYEVAHDNQTPYQWTGQSPEIDVHNFGPRIIEGVHLTFSLAAPDSSPRRFTLHLPNGGTEVVDVVAGETRQVVIILSANPGPNTLTITTTGDGEAMGKAMTPTTPDKRIVFGKIIDLRATVADPNVAVGVVQQRVE
jgi:hypothetical protein